MAWLGYFEYDGSEIINVARTEAYAKSNGMYWLRAQFKNDALPYMLGDGLRYSSPFLDDAPWTDEDVPESHDFCGLYPLEVTGIEDSSRSSTPVENILNGGVPGRLRHGMKTLVFNCLLIARTDAGANYGQEWLRKVLLGGACGPDVTSACNGGTLCYLKSEPDMYLPDELPTAGFEIQTTSDGEIWVDDPEDCLTPYLRSLRRVVFNTGPTVTSKRTTSDGSEVWTVTFTAIVGCPYEYGAEFQVLQGLMDDDRHGGSGSNSGPGGGSSSESEGFDDSDHGVKAAWVHGEPDDGMLDMEGHTHSEPECVQTYYQPLYDPENPNIVLPPEPPSVPLSNWTKPKNWTRRTIRIPKKYVPMWGEVVPKIDVHAKKGDLRSLRIRFYADPYGDADSSDDDCEYCGDIVISYVPQDHTLCIDGAEQVVYVETPGGSRRRADSLVFDTDGKPFEWPTLTCGFGYLVTLDLPQTQTTPSFDLSLYSRVT